MVLINKVAKFLGKATFSLRRSLERNGFQIHNTPTGYAITESQLLDFLSIYDPDQDTAERAGLLADLVRSGADWNAPENFPLPDGVTPDYTGAGTTTHQDTPVHTPGNTGAHQSNSVHTPGNTGAHQAAPEKKAITSSDFLSNSWVLFALSIGAILLQAYVFEIAIVRTLQDVGHNINNYQAYVWAVLMELVGLLIAVNMKSNQDNARWFWLSLFFGSQLLMDMSLVGILPFAVAKTVVSYSLPVVILACSHLYIKNEKKKWKD